MNNAAGNLYNRAEQTGLLGTVRTLSFPLSARAKLDDDIEALNGKSGRGACATVLEASASLGTQAPKGEPLWPHEPSRVRIFVDY
jgi:hypothetical protein